MIGGAAIAQRYARALFALGEEQGDTAALLAHVDAFTVVVLDSDALQSVLFTPIHPRAERRGVVRELAEKLGVPNEVRSFVMILVDGNRTALLPDIRDAFSEMVEQAAGRVSAHVSSARPLSPEQLQAIVQALSQRVGSEVSVETAVDPSLIGGVVATIGDLLFDGSVRTQLATLGASLRKGMA